MLKFFVDCRLEKDAFIFTENSRSFRINCCTVNRLNTSLATARKRIWMINNNIRKRNQIRITRRTIAQTSHASTLMSHVSMWMSSLTKELGRQRTTRLKVKQNIICLHGSARNPVNCVILSHRVARDRTYLCDLVKCAIV